nr:tetratricopeptide repeat protein [Ramlibacter cellulosilyticus]
MRDVFGRGGQPAVATRPSPSPSPPPATPAWRTLGNQALAAGDLAEARRCYEQGVLAEPGDAALRMNLGYVLLEQGQFAGAAERLAQALALRRPQDGFAHEAHFLLGRAQAALGQNEDALRSFEAATLLKPDFVEAFDEGTRALHQLERHAEAAQWARRLCDLRPDPFTRMVLGNELLLAGQSGDAAAVLAEVRAADPGNLEAAVLHYRALIKAGRVEEALAAVDRALELGGRTAPLLVMRSVPLERLARFDEGLACLDEALALEPHQRDALVNRGSMLLQTLRVAESVAAVEEALRTYPDDADLHWTLSIGLMLLGDYRRGWAEGEWRMRSVAFRNKALQLSQPQWQGEDLAGRTLFVHTEQGFGDAIQFLRFVPQVAARAKEVLLLIPPGLEPLVAGVLPANCRILPQRSLLPPIDFHCPLMSVPAVLGCTLENLPAQVPYLFAEEGKVQAWRARLGTDRLNVGIAWSGNARHVNDHNRSMALATFRSLQAQGCRFVTVQPELREADRAELAAWAEAVDHGRELRNFADTAALVQALDLVITVDTSIAHLAGALGKPVWILLPWVPDWRWMLERSDSPWYPSARLHRQPAAGEWGPVLAQVHRDLAQLAQGR